jgi:hypothetical protein
MPIDYLPTWVFFLLSVGLVILAVETGFRLGRKVLSKNTDESQPTASSIASVILGLQAFMLAFTFGIVANRYDARRTLARDEANSIRTTWQRADFLPEADRIRSKALLKDYTERRIAIAQAGDLGQARDSLKGFRDTLRQLWDIAVTNGRTDLNSQMGALYIQSLNEIANLHATRVVIGLDARIPLTIWIALLSLMLLGMTALGYHSALANSRRSRVIPILATAFSLVLTLIAALDQPGNGLMPVSQQPLINVLGEMKEQAGPTN